jgi:hypothetical protein
MKLEIFYLKLNEKQVREVIRDIFANKFSKLAGQDYFATYKIEFLYDKNGELCVHAIAKFSRELDEDTGWIDYVPISELIDGCKMRGENYAYVFIDNEMLITYISYYFMIHTIRGLPRKKQLNEKIKLFGRFSDNFRCLVATSEVMLNDDEMQLLDSKAVGGLEDLNLLKAKRIQLVE